MQVEEAFRTFKSDLAIRPIFRQEPDRVEAHVFVAFLAYCSYVTLGRQLMALAPGLTARSALEKFAAVQRVDVRIPTTDGRELQLTRYTQPEPELGLLLERLAEELGSGALAHLIRDETHSCHLGDRSHRHDWGYGCGTCPARAP